MQYPVVFHLGPLHLPAHLLFEMLAYTLGFRLYVWQRTKVTDPISDENRWWIFIGAVGGALFGGHLLGTLEKPLEPGQFTWVYFLANKTVLGGFLGGLAGVEWTKKIIGVRVSSGDLMTYPIILGLCIGRIGCHLAGLTDGTHGTPADLPWAMDFGDGIRRHPVNLYEILWLTGLAGLIYWQDHRSGGLADGMKFKIFMIGYLIWRLFAEWLKPVYFWPGISLTTIQLAALAGLLYYAWILFLRPNER